VVLFNVTNQAKIIHMSNFVYLLFCLFYLAELLEDVKAVQVGELAIDWLRHRVTAAFLSLQGLPEWSKEGTTDYTSMCSQNTENGSSAIEKSIAIGRKKFEVVTNVSQN